MQHNPAYYVYVKFSIGAPGVRDQPKVQWLNQPSNSVS